MNVIPFETSVTTSHPAFALVFHKCGSQYDAVTRHKVTDGKLAIGDYVSINDVVSMLKKSQRVENTSANSDDFIPDNVLVNNERLLCFWLAAHKRDFHCRLDKGGFHGSLNHPPLLFIADKKTREIRIFAMGTNKRPCLATSLFHAPFFNINAVGSLCLGDASTLLPKVFSPASMDAIAASFFEANGTHVNHMSTLKTKNNNISTHDLAVFLKKKLKNNDKIKRSEMQPTGKTLGEVIDRV